MSERSERQTKEIEWRVMRLLKETRYTLALNLAKRAKSTRTLHVLPTEKVNHPFSSQWPSLFIDHQWLRWWHPQWWRKVVSEMQCQSHRRAGWRMAPLDRCRPTTPNAEMPIPLLCRLANGTAELMLDDDAIVVPAGQWHS